MIQNNGVISQTSLKALEFTFENWKNVLKTFGHWHSSQIEIKSEMIQNNGLYPKRPEI